MCMCMLAILSLTGGNTTFCIAKAGTILLVVGSCSYWPAINVGPFSCHICDAGVFKYVFTNAECLEALTRVVSRVSIRQKCV